MNSLFSSAWSSIAGWKPEEFRFLLPNGDTNPAVPFSSFEGTVAWTIAYLVGVFSLQHFMKSQKPVNLKSIMIVHNGLLTVFSLILLLLIIENLIPVWQRGLWYSLCTAEQYPNFFNLQFLYYINYVFKYYELLDTVFLLLGKKKLELIQWYHHAATLWLTYTQIAGKSTVQWIPITLNLAVHVLMYYYFFMTALGRQVWWKKHLTAFQITQFFIDLIFCYYCSTSFFIGEYYSHIYPGVTCNASLGAVVVGTGILTSYFFLFIHFFIKTYQRPKPAGATDSVSEKKKL